MTDYQLDGFEHIADLSGQIWVAFGITAQPAYVFINDGVMSRQVGALPDEDFLAVLENIRLN